MTNVVALFPPQGTLEPRRMTAEQSAQFYADAHRIIDDGMPAAVAVQVASVPADRPVIRAIVRYQAAWQEFQVAPEGEASRLAEDAETEAFWSVLAQVPKSETDLIDLYEFLEWYTKEEAQRRGQCDLDDVPFAIHAALRLAFSFGRDP